MYKISFFVPELQLDQVKQAMFKEGAGRVGDYDQCCWQSKGHGQFRPLADSKPFIGKQGTVETVEEYKVEMVCGDDCIEAVIKALYQAHPYEEPAYEAWRVEDFSYLKTIR